MSLVRIVGTILLFSVSGVIAAEPDAVIQVHADRTIAKISPFTTGACIEDVNHEIYGGLYSQMVFGESFQEPPITDSPPGLPIVCAANCLQPDGQNDNGWDQGLVFLSPSHVWVQSSAHVTRMISKNNLPRCVATECQSPNDALDVTSRISEDGKILVLQVVNSENRPLSTRLNIVGFDLTGRVVKISQIAGHLDERNQETDPDRIRPADRFLYPEFDAAASTYIFPPQSFSILRFE